MNERPALHDLATLAGAMPIGDQYLFSLKDLAEFVRLVGGPADLIALHDRLNKNNIPATLYC